MKKKFLTISSVGTTLDAKILHGYSPRWLCSKGFCQTNTYMMNNQVHMRTRLMNCTAQTANAVKWSNIINGKGLTARWMQFGCSCLVHTWVWMAECLSDLTSGRTGFWIKYIRFSVYALSSVNDWQDDIVDAFVIYRLYDYLPCRSAVVLFYCWCEFSHILRIIKWIRRWSISFHHSLSFSRLTTTFSR